MSILGFLVAFLACLACGAGGAWGMRWWLERNREIAEREDPRDTQIRELQVAVKVAREDARRAREQAAAAQADSDAAAGRTDELLHELEQARGEQARTAALLRDEITARTAGDGQLQELRRQLESRKTRIQELELELRAGQTGSQLLDPALQLGQVEA